MKSTIFIILLAMSFNLVIGQTIYTKTDTIHVDNDTIIISLPNFEENSLVWQVSADKKNWVNLSDTLYTENKINIVPKKFEKINYIRAQVYNNTCEPSFSDTMLFINYDIVEELTTSIDFVLPESIGLILKDDLFGENSTEDIETIIETHQIITSLIDTLNKNNQLEDLANAIENLQVNSAVSNFISADKKNSFSCDVANLGLGYAKGVELDLSVGAGMAYIVGLELQALGGGGVEIVYDFINLTSQIYLFTYCGTEAGILIGGKLQPALEAGAGFSGYITWLMNIPYLENPEMNLFADPVRSYSANLDISAKLGIGLDAGVSVGFTHDIEHLCSDLNLFTNCPDLITSNYKTGGVCGITASVGFGGHVGAGIEVVGGITGSVIGSCRKGIKDSYIDYVAEKSNNNRKVAGLKMALDLLSPIAVNGIYSPTTTIDISAAAAAIVYSQMDLSDCPRCGIPYVKTVDVVEKSNGMIETIGEILNDGNSDIKRKGFLLGNQPNSNLEDNSTFETFSYLDNNNEMIYSTFFTVGMGCELEPGKEYYIRSFAENKFGTTYGNDFYYKVPTDAPQVETYPATLISTTTTTLNGEVTSDGGSPITQRGFYWSKTDQTPAAGDNIEIIEGTTGSYFKEITGLEENTKYYYRAFATNAKGTTRGYTKSFTTEEESSQIVYGSFTDSRDGNTYKTVEIGDQIWMAENLKYLPLIDPPTVGSNFYTKYYVYGYKGVIKSQAKETENYNTYGVLYNWPAATDACPTGWHLPTDGEWKQLEDYLTNNGYGYGGSDIETGKSMAATSHWESSSVAGSVGNDILSNNASGFSALPGGLRFLNDAFLSLNRSGVWWSATQINNSNYAWRRSLGYLTSVMKRSDDPLEAGYSVRCIKD